MQSDVEQNRDVSQAESSPNVSQPLSFEKIDGVTGFNDGTGVFRADLSDIEFDINSINIVDSGSGQGGATGKFSGFDLDAIKISNVKIDNAQEVNNISGLDIFDFSPDRTILAPGTQRPGDFGGSELIGTANGKIDNASATLGSFDSNSSTASFDGAVSLGDGGKIAFDLKKTVEQGQPLYLYIGESGNNGETPEGLVTVSNQNLIDTGKTENSVNNSENKSEITPGSNGSEKKLKFTLTESSTTSVNELGVFVTDNENGEINGISPGEDGYTQAALEQGKVVFSALAENGLSDLRNSRELSLGTDENLGFYLIRNGTTDQVLSDLNAGNTPTNIFFNIKNANSDNLDHLQIIEKEDGISSLAWEENPDDNGADFNDMVIDFEVSDESLVIGSNLQGDAEKEIIDLTGQEGKEIEASFKVESRAAYNNIAGLYKIANEDRTVVDPLSGKKFSPGDSGYTQAALQNSVVEFDRNGTEPVILEGGALYAPYLIADGNQNSVYFPDLEANSDGLDHVRLFGDNTFGFEDLAGIGDGDYNDMVFSIDLTVK